jgi:membrane associated rhomboid family serine protease
VFPLHDNIPYRVFPIMNYAMIGICSIVFLLQLADETDGRSVMVEQYGMIPAFVAHPDQPVVIVEQHEEGGRIVQEERQVAPVINPWFTLVTCVFLHGGWLHFLGNMWFLHIFGDNVEDRLGHVGYVIFYLFCGAMASVTHLMTNLGSPIPTIGASGAIAGVMGAYMLLYPHSKVTSVVPLLGFIQVMVLPAPLFLGFWFLLQFVQGAASITSVQTTGVAWWAHVGGFFVGAVIAALLRGMGQTNPAVQQRRHGEEHVGVYRRSQWQ